MKKRMIKGLAVAAAAAMSLSVTAVPVSAEAEPYKVAFICKSYTDLLCLNVRNEFEEQAADYADLISVDYFDSENSASTQINQIETCTASGYDVIVFQQVDAEAPVEAVKAALDKGIYVVVTVGHVEDDGASWYVDADPYQQGEALIDFAIEDGYCDDAQIAILAGVTGNFHAENRLAAFEDALAEKEDATLVATEYCDWLKDAAMTTTQNWLVAYPDLDVVIASCDDMALGAIEAIEMAGKEDQVKVFSIDGTDAGIEAVADGRLMCTVQQDAVLYASETLTMVEALLNGEDVESIQIDSTLITAKNVDEYIAAEE